MEILIIGDQLSQLEYWQSIVALATPGAQITTTIFDLEGGAPVTKNYDLVFLIAEKGHPQLLMLVQQLTAAQCAFICSIEHLTTSFKDQLTELCIKGYINVHSNLSEVQSAVRIVSGKRGAFLCY